MVLFIAALVVFTIGGLIFAVFKASVGAVAARMAIDEPEHVRIINVKRGFLTNMVMFEKDDKTRIELAVTDKDAGVMVEVDEGMLVYHGTAYKAFERKL